MFGFYVEIAMCACSVVVTSALAIIMATKSRYEAVQGVYVCVAMLTSMSIWTLFYIFELFGAVLEVKIVMVGVEYIGIFGTILSFVAIVIAFCFKRAFTKLELIISAMFAVFFLTAAWTNFGNLFYTQLAVKTTAAGVVLFNPVYGPLFYTYQGINAITVLFSIFIIITRVIKKKMLLSQGILLVAAIGIPITCVALNVTRISPYDFTNPSFMFTAIALYYCFKMYGVFDSITYVKRHILELHDAVTFIVNEKNIIEYVNPAALNLFKADLVAVKGKHISALLTGIKDEDILPNFDRVIMGGSGEQTDIYFRLVELKNEKRTFDGKLLIGHNMTMMHQLERKLDYLKIYDETTGLFNGTKLVYLMNEYYTSHHQGLAGTFVCAASISNLSMLSGVLTKEQLRELVNKASDYISQNAQEGHVVARFGDNEFYIFSNGVPFELSELVTTLEKLSNANVTIGRQTVMLEFKLGVYLVEDGVETDVALSNVAFALNNSLSTRGTSVKVYDRKLKFQHDLHRYLVTAANTPNYERDFVLEFQPIVEVATNRVAGAEALVRWNHPSLGRIDPKIFVPVFENTGHMKALGQALLEKVLTIQSEWKNKFEPDFFLSINISRKQIQDPAFISELKELFVQTGAVPHQMRFELKAQLIQSNLASAVECAQSLRELGSSVMIDGFGWDNFTIPNIFTLQCDLVKLDNSISKDITKNHAKAAVVQSMFEMCEQNGVRLIAGHVENLQELKVYRQQGFQLAQGFIFCKPLNAAEFEKYCLRTHDMGQMKMGI